MVTSECRNPAHFLLVPFRLKGKYRAHSIDVSMCASLGIGICNSGSHTVGYDGILKVKRGSHSIG